MKLTYKYSGRPTGEQMVRLFGWHIQHAYPGVRLQGTKTKQGIGVAQQAMETLPE